MIDLKVNSAVRDRAARVLGRRGVVLPTFAQMTDPGLIPDDIKAGLARTGLWQVDPLNLFRVTWHNQPQEHGGGFGPVNAIEFGPELTGVPARIIGLVGRWFPTGSHKVGATYGCLMTSLVTGRFDPDTQRAVWPSTGNFCRGGAFNSALIGCPSIAVLPEEMSQERFEWLSEMAGEVIKTPGCESNVKEIYDKCAELRAQGDDLVIFNQFEEFGNYLWHYAVTGPALTEVYEAQARPGDRLTGYISATGSAGTIAAGDWLKQTHPRVKIAAVEALQCPTLLLNGYGGHRIEGIGDKHVPWIHNCRHTDAVIAVDDADPIGLIRLFNEPAGRQRLLEAGLSQEQVAQLPLVGISGAANLVAAIKLAKYFELDGRDHLYTVLTDSMDLYGSRLAELTDLEGPYGEKEAAADYARRLMGQTEAGLMELGHYDRKRIHNLKYFTWVEQQGKTAEELTAQWSDWPDYWTRIQESIPAWDKLIVEFNRRAKKA